RLQPLDAVLEVLQGGDLGVDGRPGEVLEARVVRVQRFASRPGRRVLEVHLFEVAVGQGRQLALLRAGPGLSGGAGGQQERGCKGDPELSAVQHVETLLHRHAGRPPSTRRAAASARTTATTWLGRCFPCPGAGGKTIKGRSPPRALECARSGGW